MTSKPLSFETSRQLRPILARLKRLVEQGLDNAPPSIATCLGLTPLQPTQKQGHTNIWRGAKIGKIAATFEVIWNPDLSLVICPRRRVATTDDDALLILEDIFGPVSKMWSPKGQSWFSEYTPPLESRWKLIVCFEKPTKTEHQTLFSVAILRPVDVPAAARG
ncbi:MAG: hypothetical protein ABL901_21470 [Hyphomicrobiaceae bacterium]